MKPLRSLDWLVLALFCLMVNGRAQETPEILIEHLTEQSEVVYDYRQGIGWGTNGVVVRYTNAVLTARQVRVDIKSGEAQAQGDVSLQRGNEVWRGERLLYNFKTQQIEADNFRGGKAPVFFVGDAFTSNPTNQTYVLKGGRVTTDDVAEPGYEVRAKSVKVVPGKFIEARNATLVVGGVPVMFFPYYKHRLDQEANHWVLTPGYRSSFGPFLLATYNWIWSTNLHGALNLDYRQKRGFGVGPDLGWNLGRWGTGDTRFYYTHDDDPGKDQAGARIDPDRQRFSLTHQATLATNLTAKLVVRQQSDSDIIRDFFEPEYRPDPQPKSFLELNRAWPNWTLDLMAQPQLNDFSRTVERLPDLKLTGIRQQLGISPFFYESDSSAGYFRFQPEDGTNLMDYAAMRFDTYHQLLLPQTYFGWLNFTPRAGGRLTHYGASEGEGTTLEEANRGVFNTGAEVSFKLSQTWAGARSRILDANGIRHILEPSFNYVFVPNPSKAPAELPQFDTEIPSLRLLPINFPDYNSIDSIDSQNVLRLGLRNKIQTKRGDDIQNLVNWTIFTDLRLDPDSDQTRFSDLYTEIDLRPRSWLSLSSELRYGVDDGQIRYANSWLTLMPNDIWSFSLGHFYFPENSEYGSEAGNSLFRTSLYYRLNENWGFRTTLHYEADDGVLEDQYYTLYRDLRSWTAALTFRVRRDQSEPTDFTVALMFSIKAFPRYGVGRDRSHHSLLLGG